MNEMANICERVGADINKVRTGIGSDRRIGYSFIYPGCGYGGSCFPKDVRALEKLASENEYTPKVLKSVQEVNESQKLVIAQKVIKKFGRDLSKNTFAVWGLSFKPETDDTREASSIAIINELTKHGAKIKAYDPKAMDVARKYYLKDNKNIEYVDSKYTALCGADALLLITEWKEFRSPDFNEIITKLNNKIIFDGRNQYNKESLNKLGIEYYQIGVKS
jgi:UDPglucose 6-dehydrogenase